jgi:hypothetical protein
MAGSPARRRNPLLPWWIGLGIILAAVAYVAYAFASLDNETVPVLAFIVLGVIPVVYLVLMYLSFTSQAQAEDEIGRGGYDPRSGRG